MLKKILVPLDPSPYSDAAISYVISIAKKHDATIYGLTIMDFPDIEDSIGAVPIGGFYWAKKLEETRKKEAEEKLDEISFKFAQKLKEANVKFVLEEVQGLPSKEIIEYSQYYDLVIIGLRNYFEFETSDKEGNSLSELLSHSITPILAVPKEYRQINNILIAFDGSFASSRALQRFAHLASAQDYNFVIITSTSDSESALEMQVKAATYLEAYGIKKIKRVITDKNIISEIKANYLDWADVVVLGAHSKNIFKDFFIGSLTKELININEKPLFIGF